MGSWVRHKNCRYRHEPEMHSALKERALCGGNEQYLGLNQTETCNHLWDSFTFICSKPNTLFTVFLSTHHNHHLFPLLTLYNFYHIILIIKVRMLVHLKLLLNWIKGQVVVNSPWLYFFGITPPTLPTTFPYCPQAQETLWSLLVLCNRFTFFGAFDYCCN